MIWLIARKEMREIVRDGRLRLLGVIVVILALAALAFGLEQTLRAQHAREHAMERSTDQWEGQGEKNPHVAAHYGTYVFAPTSAVTAIDPGVAPYLGRSIEIKAHKRSLAAHSEAQDSGGSKRLGAFSVASVFLQLIPLLIIALGYGSWSRERERGTLRQVLSTGVTRHALFWGKALALGMSMAGLLVPAGLVIVGALWAVGGGDAATLMRVGLLAASYTLYFAIFACLTLFVSAMANTSRGALVTMVGIWGLFCLVMPRAASEVSGLVEPLPSRAELARKVGAALKTGLDGSTERDVAIEARVADAMDEQGFSADALSLFADEKAAKEAEMVKAGLLLRFAAEWENEIFDHFMNGLDDQIASQEAVVDWAGFLSPYVAMRSLSSTLSGTDFAHHRHFTGFAERWRQDLINSLNKAFTDNAGAQGWDYRAGKELWKNAPPFTYRSPGPMYGLWIHAVSGLALLFWFFVALGLAWWGATRVRVV